MNEKTAKQLRRPIPEHLHCNECHLPVTPDDARQGVMPVALPQPNGQLAIVPRPVPLCPTCHERIQAAEQQAKAQQSPSSRLVVPRGVVKPV